MKVGIVINRLDPEKGGAYTYKTSIINALVRLESVHEFILLDVAEDPHRGDSPLPYLHVRQYTENTFRANHRGGFETHRLHRLLSAFRIAGERGPRENLPATLSDCISRAITQEDIAMAWFIDLVDAHIHVPFFYTIWDLQHRLQPWFPEVSWQLNTWHQREKTYTHMLKKASLIITGTSAGKQEIMQFYGVDSSNIDVVPMPVPDLPPAASKDRAKSIRHKYDLHGAYLLYPAQFWAHKNHVNLLMAIQILKSTRGFSPQLVLVGSDKGNLAHVKNKVNELGLDEQVVYLGFIPYEDLLVLYQDAMCLVFVSYFGPDNIPPLEAFSYGCPVVASQVPGAVEQLGEAAILVDPNEPEDIARAVWTLCENGEQRDLLVANGRKIIDQNSSASYVSRILGHFDRFDRILRNWI